MTASPPPDRHPSQRSAQQVSATPPARAGARRSADGDDLDPQRVVEIASEVGEAAAALGRRLRDPALGYDVDEIERVTQCLAATVAGVATGVEGITEWLRAAGYAGALSGHSSAVADRLAHAGDELALLTQAIGRAGRRAS